ncbi:MAG: ATP-binding protein [Salinibacter sp.]
MLLLLVGAPVAVGQPDAGGERGIPFPSEHYAPPEYRQSPQNWDVVQGPRGLIYVANNDGVLRYDGERWDLIPTSSFVRSLAVDSLVFVGIKGDFGYLRPDSTGELHYRSLYDQIPPDERDFGDVWNTHVLDEGVYYQTNKRLFRWDGTDITSWSSEKRFHTSFAVNGTLYVRDEGPGLLRMEGDSLEPAPSAEAFHDTPIYMMAPHPSGGLLVGTQNKGLLLYDGKTVQSFAPQLTSYLRENDLYHGCWLPGDRYALGTVKGGTVIVDAEGEVVRVLKKSSGLPNNTVNHVYAGREGQLWIALNRGIFRANLNAPLTIHDQRTGLEGRVLGIYKPNDTTYVATASGLYVLRTQNQVLRDGNGKFERWGSIPVVRDMQSFDGRLLAGTREKGAYQIEGRTKDQIGDWIFTHDLLKPEGTEIVYAGTRSGLKGLTRTQDEWTSFSVEEIQEEVRSLTAEGDSVLWASTTGGVIRVLLSPDGRKSTEVIRYDTQDGLPEGEKGVATVNGKVTVFSREGLFQIEDTGPSPTAWQFDSRPSLLPNVEGADTMALKSYRESEDGDLWVALGNRVFVGHQTGNETYSWEAVEPLHFPKPNKVTLSIERDSTIWLSDGRRLFRYAPSERREIEPPQADFQALVQQVTTLPEARVVYGGNPSGLGPDTALTIPYGKDLRIEVAAPLYSTVEPHQYRYKLVGRSDQWSDWTKKASWQYRDPWEGTYHFRVQARNDRGRTSKVASLTLHIQPPWYRSRWAFLFYGVAFIVVAYGYRRYYLIKEEKQRARERVRKLEQERVVAERLKQANERLREANRLKEEFLATTSHELRTPLTNILGSLEVLRDTATDEQKSFLDIIEKNGKRLKRTLNALLDLSMLRSEDEEPDLSPTPIGECARQVASDFRDEAEENGLSFWVDTPEVPVHADVDEQYLEQVLRNLLENALKFTDEGHVAVSVSRNNDRVHLEVEDTGIGIDEDFLPDLFEEFRQESRGRDRTYEGNGLGLAISSRLVEQMNGTIGVETTKGEGSTFMVEFPRSDVETASTPEEA